MDNQRIHIHGIDTSADLYAIVYYPDLIGSPIHLFMPEQTPGQGHVCLTIKPCASDPEALAAALASFTDKRDKEVVFYQIAQSLANVSARKHLGEVHAQARDSELHDGFLVYASLAAFPALRGKDLPFAMEPERMLQWEMGTVATSAEEAIECHFRRVERSLSFAEEDAEPVISYISRVPRDTSAFPWCTRERVFLDTARNLPLGYRHARRVPYFAIRNLECITECFKDLRLNTWYLAAVDTELCDVTRNAEARKLLGIPENYQNDCVTSPYLVRSTTFNKIIINKE